jgi:hypothetical protein
MQFTLDVDVTQGRMTRVALGHVALERHGSAHALAAARWPRELVDYVACLTPHLTAVGMDPAPADGSYEPAYSFEGRPAGRPAP